MVDPTGGRPRGWHAPTAWEQSGTHLVPIWYRSGTNQVPIWYTFRTNERMLIKDCDALGNSEKQCEPSRSVEKHCDALRRSKRIVLCSTIQVPRTPDLIRFSGIHYEIPSLGS